MANVPTPLDPGEALQLWATLAAEGKAPTELTRAAHLLPAYSVGIEPWIDRLASRYLAGLCRQHAHFKLVLGPYGGGKTHFLVALGSRALAEGFAAAYVPCGPGVNLDSPLDVYREFVRRLQLPGESGAGLQRLLARVVEAKRAQIAAAGAPEPDYAFEMWLKRVSREAHPENAFGRVIAEALRSEWDPDRAPAGDAALRWLQGDIDALTREELALLRLARVSARARGDLGRNLLMSVIRFVKEGNVAGVVLLLDEVETLFSKALLKLLAAMRVMLDYPGDIPGGVPLLGVFAAVPDIQNELTRYPALQQRLAAYGAPFDEGNDFSPQLHLEKLGAQEGLLAGIGHKLTGLAGVATGYRFDVALQSRNAERLARVAADRNLEVDARRLYVKTWVNILELQSREGEREFPEGELSARYQGHFDELRRAEPEGDEP